MSEQLQNPAPRSRGRRPSKKNAPLDPSLPVFPCDLCARLGQHCLTTKFHATNNPIHTVFLNAATDSSDTRKITNHPIPYIVPNNSERASSSNDQNHPGSNNGTKPRNAKSMRITPNFRVDSDSYDFELDESKVNRPANSSNGRQRRSPTNLPTAKALYNPSRPAVASKEWQGDVREPLGDPRAAKRTTRNTSTSKNATIAKNLYLQELDATMTSLSKLNVQMKKQQNTSSANATSMDSRVNPVHSNALSGPSSSRTAMGNDQTDAVQSNTLYDRNAASRKSQQGRPPTSKYGLKGFKDTRGNGQRDSNRPREMRGEPRGGNPFFDEYWTQDQMEEGLSKGTCFKGVLRINKRNTQDAYVTVEGRADDLYIFQQKYRNRALEGDVVVVTHLTREQLVHELDRKTTRNDTRKLDAQRRLQKCAIGNEEVPLETEEEVEEKEDERDLEFVKVVAIAQRVPGRVFTGTISTCAYNDDEQIAESIKNIRMLRNLWFKAGDKRVPLIAIASEYIPKEYLSDPSMFENTLFKVAIKSWSHMKRAPQGFFYGKIGQVGELPVESKCLLIDNDITWDEMFTGGVLSCLPETPWAIPQREYEKRLDLRSLPIFTIDPLTAKDLDDAVHYRALADGNVEVGVHIADVSFFISPGSDLDKEAALRATTVYLVQKAIPMLPRLLCEELCSLNPGVDRLAFSVIWKLDPEGNIIDEWFGRTIIRSRAKLSYEHAQSFIEGYSSWNDAKTNGGKDLVDIDISDNVSEGVIRDTVLKLFELSTRIRKTRYKNGALSLQNWFSLDGDGNPARCGPYQIKEANKLIEEFMLLANMSVAKRILAAYPEIALLRQHSPPNDKSLQDFIKHANTLGFTQFGSAATSSGELQRAFDSVVNPVQQIVLQMLCVRPMKRATYYCTGIANADPGFMQHFALNVDFYTHFTSPIRRYCDLIVHRLLNGALAGAPDYGNYRIAEGQSVVENLNANFKLKGSIDQMMVKIYSTASVSDIADMCNSRKNSSKCAQDASQKLFLCAYLSLEYTRQGYAADGSDSPAYETAIVHRVDTRSFDVFVPRYGIEKRVWVEDLVDLGLANGCLYNKDDGYLAIHWIVDDDLALQMASLSIAGVDDNQFIQKIQVFQQIPVRIEVLMKRSPPDFKIVAVFPATNIVEEFTIDAPCNLDEACLAILDDNN